MGIFGAAAAAGRLTTLDDLGEDFLCGREILSKYYPACGCHEDAIDLALTLRQEHKFEAKDIEQVLYRIAPRRRRLPTMILPGHMSAPYRHS